MRIPPRTRLRCLRGELASYTLFILCGIAPPINATAQLDLGTSLVFESVEDADRQLRGLADPLIPDAAISVSALRRTTANFATVTGTNTFSGSLIPAPDQLVPGMLLTILPESVNDAGVVLDLNGLGPHAIVKSGDLPLDSADLAAGVPVRLIYTGTHFRTLSYTPRNCPTGYSAVTREYCIADLPRDTTTYYNAALRCATSGVRLCTFNEWVYACQRSPTFFATVPSGEWVDHAANHASTAKLVGIGDPIPTCSSGSLSVPTGLFRYRCCSSR